MPAADGVAGGWGDVGVAGEVAAGGVASGVAAGVDAGADEAAGAPLHAARKVSAAIRSAMPKRT
jgi:hypothetical protein